VKNQLVVAFYTYRLHYTRTANSASHLSSGNSSPCTARNLLRPGFRHSLDSVLRVRSGRTALCRKSIGEKTRCNCILKTGLKKYKTGELLLLHIDCDFIWLQHIFCGTENRNSVSKTAAWIYFWARLISFIEDL